MSEELTLEREALNDICKFMQIRPTNHFCNFCRNMNFYHRNDCPAPKVLEVLGRPYSEVKRYEGKTKAGISSEEEARLWQSDERPDDHDNPCAVCKARMPINPLTAIFGCHFNCVAHDTEGE